LKAVEKGRYNIWVFAQAEHLEFPRPFGKYVLLKKLAVGGMAEVYLAKMTDSPGFERAVVIKTLLATYSEDDEFIKMFIDEARIAAALHHKNIVQVMDFDSVEGQFYIAMEYVDGKDLRRTLDRLKALDKHMPVVMVANIAEQIASALHYAHTRSDDNGKPWNIVHRDVSPQNILLSYDSGVKLTDFGIAKAAARLTKTEVGTVKGKCAYMSPEQAQGKEVDARSDIFALCSVTWEMLTRRRLFDGNTEYEILKNVIDQAVPPPSLFRAGCPRELDAIILKGLRKDRNERYRNASELEHDLLNFVFKHAQTKDEGDVGPFLKSLFEGAEEDLQKRTSPSGEIKTKTPSKKEVARDLDEPTIAMQALPQEEASVEQPTQLISATGDDGALPTVALSPVESTLAQKALAPSTLRRFEDGETGIVKTKRSHKGVLVGGTIVLLAVAFGLGSFYVVRGRVLNMGWLEKVEQESGVAENIARDAGTGHVIAESQKAPTKTETLQNPEPPLVAGTKPPEFVTLRVKVEPKDASVLVDGIKVLVTKGEALVEEKYRLGDKCILTVEAKGYKTSQETVVLNSKEKVLSVALQRTRETQPTATGFVTINAKPWADVFYKGRKIGTTPIQKMEFPTGRHVFVLKNPFATKNVVLKVQKGLLTSAVVDMQGK
jgi:serine/threonine protein kinase